MRLDNQRALNRLGIMRKDRQELLDNIGFVWSVKESRKEVGPGLSCDPPIVDETMNHDRHNHKHETSSDNKLLGYFMIRNAIGLHQ